MDVLPRRLQPDAIAEALCEVRFESADSNALPEIVFSRLLDCPLWQTFDPVRLPLAEMPAALRAQTPDLKYSPVIEMRGRGSSRIVKLGPWSVSYHITGPYPGWDTFSSELSQVFEFLFSRFSDFRAVRLGFRYVNVLTAPGHGINSLRDLNFEFTIADELQTVPQLLTFNRPAGERHIATVKIASPEFVQGWQGPAFTALLDVDVATPSGVEMRSIEDAKRWVSDAHNVEKAEFFRLLRPATIDKLRADDV